MTYYGSISGVTGVTTGDVLISAESTSQAVEAQFFTNLNNVYAAYLSMATAAGKSNLPQSSASSTLPVIPSGANPATYLYQSMQSLLQLAQNGVQDSSNQQTSYLTGSMANVVNVLSASFQQAGLTNFSPISIASSTDLTNLSNTWLNTVSAPATSTSSGGIFAPVNPSTGSAQNLTPLIMQASYVAEQINRSLQSMIATNYIANGNTILSNQLSSLDTQLTAAQSAVGSLNTLQDLHNQIAAPPPQNVTASNFPGDPTGFLAAASAAYGTSLVPNVVATPSTGTGSSTNAWVTYSVGPATTFSSSSGFTKAQVLNGSTWSINSNLTDQLNFKTQLGTLNQAIKTLDTAGIPATSQGSLTQQTNTVVNDIYSYIGTPNPLPDGLVETALPTDINPLLAPTTSPLGSAPTVPNTFVSTTSTGSSGSTIYYGEDYNANIVTYDPSKAITASTLNGAAEGSTNASIAWQIAFTLKNTSSPLTSLVTYATGSPSTTDSTSAAGITFAPGLAYVIGNKNSPNAIPVLGLGGTTDQTTDTQTWIQIFAKGLPNQSVYGWIMDGQSATSGGAVSSSGKIQNDITQAITSGQNLNTTLSQKTQQYLFVFQQFYQSASGILTTINQFIQQMTQNMGK